MPHFLIKKEEIKDNIIELSNNDNFFHLTRVLRVKVNEVVKFIDKNQNVFEAKIVELTKSSLKASILNTYKSDRILNYNLVLIQSILANDAQNLLIANATQTGVKEIYPVLSDNVSVSVASLKNKVEKWQKIALENFKQCERADMAAIHEIARLKDILGNFKKENVIIFAEKFENYSLNTCLKDIDVSKPIAVVIGPEGGFSKEEFEYFKKENFKLVTLGRMIYKAPNAVVAGVSNIISRLENYDIWRWNIKFNR